MERKDDETEIEWEERKRLEEIHKKVMTESIFSEENIDRIIKNSTKDYNMLYENKAYRETFSNSKILNYLPEGIDFDEKTHTVWYDSNTEDYVSTSEKTNPTQDRRFGTDIEVWSVFKRNKIDNRDNLDGNVLVYALKNEGGWRFKTNIDRQHIMNQIGLIIKKFNATHQYGPTVVVPSGAIGGGLNQIMANMVKELNPQTTIINDVLSKMSAQDVYDSVTKPGTLFQKTYNTTQKFNKAITDLKGYIYNMNQKRNGIFTYHFIKDSLMRSVIGQTLKLTDDSGKYSEDINGKDILIIDDTISQGNTIKYSCDLIKSVFTPNSITVLTLFSRL